MPQGSILRPMLFIRYTANTDNIAAGHGLLSHFYANDSHLVLSGRLAERDILASMLTRCSDEIDAWMASNRLKLNQDKTEPLSCATSCRIQHNDNSHIYLSGTLISPVSTVRDLDIMLASDLSLLPRINHLVSRCFYQLRCIKS